MMRDKNIKELEKATGGVGGLANSPQESENKKFIINFWP